MGAKQSKRSVDISGKEAESAGEVAAAGAGGEGRVEALADVDALKPQANGAPHIHEQTDKEKQMDSGTPENEKDATTEKEAKVEGEKSDDKEELAPVTNGDADNKPENGDSSPAPEEVKKPKKEKVKKKWSLRSFSFNRKDKPKQEKKQKEEEPKTNGEHEKVPEEAAEVTPENAANDVAEEAKPETVKEEKTPETPVTEPLTNGSSTPESPKEATDAPAQPEPAPAPARLPPQADAQPEHLPINGLSLDEQKSDASEAQSEECKPEEPAAETTETAPAPEIPVKKEVCVERMPLESTPPPLPANPPPSSVASFAASTMAPELTEASLANTAELVIPAPADSAAGDSNPAPTAPLAPADNIDNNIITAATELPPPLKEPVDEKPVTTEAIVEPHNEKVIEETIQTEPKQLDVVDEGLEAQKIEQNVEKIVPEVEKLEPEVQKSEADIEKVEPSIEQLEPPVNVVEIESSSDIKKVKSEIDSGNSNIEKLEETKVSHVTASGDVQCPESNVDTFETVKTEIISQNIVKVEESSVGINLESPEVEMPPAPVPDDLDIPEPASDLSDTIEDLPPPPPPVEEFLPVEKVGESIIVENIAHETNTNSNGISETIEINGLNTEQVKENVDTDQENLKNKTKDSLGNMIEVAECNGDGAQECRLEQVAMEESPSAVASPALPGPPAADADTPQEPIPVSDKLADLIPEVPVVPELNTQTETSSDVAVAN